MKPLLENNFGYAPRTLQPMTVRVLAQDYALSACERNYSVYSLKYHSIDLAQDS